MTWEGDICPVCQQPSETKRDYVTVDHFDCVLKLKAELDAERKKRCMTCAKFYACDYVMSELMRHNEDFGCTKWEKAKESYD